MSSTNPTAGASAWSVAHITQKGNLTAISCPSTTLCIAGDSSGHVLSSSDPTGSAAAWKLVATDSGDPIAGVSCGFASLCVAVDLGGGVLSSSAPASGPWKRAEVAPTIPPQDQFSPPTDQSFSAVSCASNQLCAAVVQQQIGDSQDSSPAVSQNPTHGGSWTINDSAYTTDVTTISCPSNQLCVAVDTGGQAVIGVS